MMEAARKEIRDERLCMGQEVGRFVVTDFDLEPRIPAGGAYVGLVNGYERRVIRWLPVSECWQVSAYTKHPMGWLADGSEPERAATFTAALDAVRAA